VNKPLISSKTSKAGPIILALFFSIFFFAGIGMLFPITIQPISRTIAAISWVETPCEITNAEVTTNSDSDGDTYGVSITYRYTFEEVEFSSNKFTVMENFSSSGYRSKEKIVEQYREAGDTICFVNPQNPSEAVLKRGFHPILFFTLFPFPFILIGLFGMMGKLGTKQTRPDGSPVGSSNKGKGSGFYFESPVETDLQTGSKEMRPEQKRMFSVLGLTFVNLFWNGIVSVFIYFIFFEGSFELFPALFITPFVLIGLLILFGWISAILALFNPVPVLRFDSYPIRLGKPTTIQWRFEGQSSRITHLKIKLTGKESATYTRGTDSYTDTQLFYHEIVCDTTSRAEIAANSATISIPATLVHSFESSHNSIIWELELSGSIANWPDISDSFILTVTPAVREVPHA